PGGAQRQANLDRLLDLARAFDGFTRQGLQRFLRFVQRLQERGADLGAVTPPTTEGDAVQVLSIHQSKGLEYPVVLVADLGRRFNRDDLSDPVLLHRDLGLGPRLVDPDRGVRSEPAAREALKHRLAADALAEEMRVLYVAMTRARERLILIGSISDVPAALRRWCSLIQHEAVPLPDAYLMEADSFLDLLGPCLARHRHGGPVRDVARSTLLPPDRGLFDHPSRWDIRVWEAGEDVTLVPPATDRGAGLGAVWRQLAQGRAVDLPLDEAGAAQVREVAGELARRLDWSLPTALLGGLHAKSSVTELKGAADPETDEPGGPGERGEPVLGVEPAGEEEPAAPWIVSGGWRAEPPQIDTAGDPAPAPVGTGARRRGTVTHLVLQHLDLSRPLNARDIRAQVDDLVSRQVLAPDQAASVPVERLALFFASPLGRRMRAASGLRREVPFLLRLPAAEVHRGPAPLLDGEWVLVQGVVDAVWREGEGLVIVDFKTDRVTGDPAALAAERGYDRQLRLYARAIAAAHRRPVTEACAVFLATGAVVPVDLRATG
ncbi:MAG TPA: 3'-5' exonuclease, partial [Bacillota bacterium]